MEKKSKKIIGSLVFRNDGDGCLTSKYHHNESVDGPFTEACKLVSAPNVEDIYIGTYRTVWLDDNNDFMDATLIIEISEINNRIYKLSWRHSEDGDNLFTGTAMKFGDLLIGAYWD
jgi:hypothetical protein